MEMKHSSCRIFIFISVLGLASSKSGFNGTEKEAYALTTTFRMPRLNAMTACSWVKLSDAARTKPGSDMQILTYFNDEDNNPPAISLYLSLPNANAGKDGAVTARLNGNVFSVAMKPNNFDNFYNNWRSICFSWDLTISKGVTIFVDSFLQTHSVKFFNVKLTKITGGSPILVSRYFNSKDDPSKADSSTQFIGIIGTVEIWNTTTGRNLIQSRRHCNVQGNVYSMDTSDFTLYGKNTVTRADVEVKDVCNLAGSDSPQPTSPATPTTQPPVTVAIPPTQQPPVNVATPTTGPPVTVAAPTTQPPMTVAAPTTQPPVTAATGKVKPPPGTTAASTPSVTLPPTTTQDTSVQVLQSIASGEPSSAAAQPITASPPPPAEMLLNKASTGSDEPPPDAVVIAVPIAGVVAILVVILASGLYYKRRHPKRAGENKSDISPNVVPVVMETAAVYETSGPLREKKEHPEPGVSRGIQRYVPAHEYPVPGYEVIQLIDEAVAEKTKPRIPAAQPSRGSRPPMRDDGIYTAIVPGSKLRPKRISASRRQAPSVIKAAENELYVSSAGTDGQLYSKWSGEQAYRDSLASL